VSGTGGEAGEHAAGGQVADGGSPDTPGVGGSRSGSSGAAGASTGGVSTSGAAAGGVGGHADDGTAGESGAGGAGASGASGAGGATEPQPIFDLSSCGKCPEGFTVDTSVAFAAYPTCKPPNGECRAAGFKCIRDNAAAFCTGVGQCEIAACVPGWDDCDDNESNGCESVLTSVESCGACGNVCPEGSFCANGQCKQTCDLPLIDCGNGTCANLATDESNCGQCGTSCGLNSCKEGACGVPCPEGFTMCMGVCSVGPCPQPVQDCKLCGSVIGPIQQCTNGNPSQTCCGDGFEYQTFNGKVLYCSDRNEDVPTCTGACPTSPLRWVSGLSEPTSLFVLDGEVFWVDAQLLEIAGASETSPAKRILASGLSRPRYLTGIADELYWADNVGNVVMKVSKTGAGSAEVFVTAANAANVAVDETHVYWTQTSPAGLWRKPRAGGASEPFAPSIGDADASVGAVTVDDRFVYFLRGTKLARVDKLDLLAPLVVTAGGHLLSAFEGAATVAIQGTGTVLGSVTADGTRFRLSEDPGNPGDLLRVADYTYWGTQAGAYSHVFISPNCSGAARRLVNAPSDVRSVALSDEYLYFATGDWIGRIPRVD
jgi:hypothetical protein